MRTERVHTWKVLACTSHVSPAHHCHHHHMIFSVFKVQMSQCLRKFVAVKIEGRVLTGQVQLTEYGDWLDVGEEVNLGGFLCFYI